LKELQGWQLWKAVCGLQAWEVFFRYHGTLFGIVGLFFLIAFSGNHTVIFCKLHKTRTS